MRFKTELSTCSQFPTEAMLWIKEVEMVDSVDDLKSSLSIRGISMPNFEVLDARIASALNKIIHNSHFQRSVSLEEQKAQKQDRFLRGRQIAYLICEYFRVTGANDSVENYADLFTISRSSLAPWPRTSLPHKYWVTTPKKFGITPDVLWSRDITCRHPDDTLPGFYISLGFVT